MNDVRSGHGDDTQETLRIQVALFVVHPTATPDEITSALGLEPRYTQCVGMQRQTPMGDLLVGVYRDTRWRYLRRFDSPGQHFASAITSFLDEISTNAAAIRALRSSGGDPGLILSFLGDGHYGDTLPVPLLERLTGMGLTFGIEVYSVPQN